MLKQDTIRKLARFGLVGGLVAGVHLALLWYFHSIVGLGARTSYWAGYFPALTLHFCLSKWWTFRCSRRDFIQQGVRYALVAALAQVGQFGIHHAALLWVTSTPQIAYVISAGLGMGLSFVLMQRAVFRGAAVPAPDRAA